MARLRSRTRYQQTRDGTGTPTSPRPGQAGLQMRPVGTLHGGVEVAPATPTTWARHRPLVEYTGQRKWEGRPDPGVSVRNPQSSFTSGAAGMDAPVDREDYEGQHRAAIERGRGRPITLEGGRRFARDIGGVFGEGFDFMGQLASAGAERKGLAEAPPEGYANPFSSGQFEIQMTRLAEDGPPGQLSTEYFSSTPTINTFGPGIQGLNSFLDRIEETIRGISPNSIFWP